MMKLGDESKIDGLMMCKAKGLPHVGPIGRIAIAALRKLLGCVLGLIVLMLVAVSGTSIHAQEVGDAGWPREFAADGMVIRIYQPQLEQLNDVQLSGRAAISVQKQADKEPAFGAIWFDARIETDKATRLIRINALKVPQYKFPSLDDATAKRVAELIVARIDNSNLEVSLDRVIAALQEVKSGPQAALDMKPPKIIVSKTPAALILIDGDPELRPVPDSSLMTVVNSAYMIVLDPKQGRYYLSSGLAWYSTKDLKSDWQRDANPPKAVTALIDTQGNGAPLKDVPLDVRIIVSTEAAELINIDGEPSFTPLVGGSLLAVKNTEDDVLFDATENAWYVLISGRWYTSASLEGPWAYRAADDLPASFSQIPEDSKYGNLLASVAGTRLAREAVLDAQIPQTAAVEKSKAKTEVVYDGDPKFEPIAGTEIKYALNTTSQVVYAEGRYYVVDNGVWFVSDKPTGPWTVAVTVPAAIYAIPPSSPVYNITCVRIYDDWGDVVYTGYTSCYTGSYVYGGTVVYGTGYYYRPWISPYHYYARPRTFGFYFGYNPWTGGWYAGIRVGGPFLGVGIAWGSACRCTIGGIYGGWWGIGGIRPWPSPYRRSLNVNINRGLSISNNRIRINRNVWRDNFTRGNFDRRTHLNEGFRKGTRILGDRNIYVRPQNRDRLAPQAKLPAINRGKVTPRDRDVLVDKSGNVFRRTKDGGWEQRRDKSWSKVEGRPQLRPEQKPALTKPAQKPALTKPAQKPALTKPVQKPALTKPVQKPALTKSERGPTQPQQLSQPRKQQLETYQQQRNRAEQRINRDRSIQQPQRRQRPNQGGQKPRKR